MGRYSYLDLSTAHLTEDEANALDDTSGDSMLCGSRVIPHNYGAWVHVPPADEDMKEDDEARAAHYPNLHACVVLARSQCALWINFDCDGDGEASLPSFEW